MYHNAGAEQYHNAFSAIGAGWVRDEIRWENVEKTKGKYEIPDKVEKMTNAMIKNKRKALIILGYGNTLYDMPSIAVVPTTEAQLKGFENYVRYVMQYIKDKGISAEDIVFEIWNEYSGGMSNSTAVPGEHYVNLVKIARQVADEIMPDVKIMSEGMAHVTKGEGRSRFETYCKTGVFDYAEIVGMHPYTKPVQPDVDNLFAGAVDEFRTILNENNINNMPVFHSEMGWPVYQEDDYGKFSERESAINIIRMYTLNKQMQKKYNQNDVLIVYKGADQKYTRTTEDFGLLNLPWFEDGENSAKVSYVSFDAAVSLLGNAEFIESNEGENLKIFKFKKADGKDLLVLWTEEKTEDIKLNCTEATAYDMLGNIINIPVKNNYISFSATREPVFIEGSFDSIIPETADVVITEYSEFVLNGSECLVTLKGRSELSGKRITITPELPLGWKWENSGDVFYADETNLLKFSVPEGNGDCMNRIVLNLMIDTLPTQRLEFFAESGDSIYSDNLLVDHSIEGSIQANGERGSGWTVKYHDNGMIDKEIYHDGKQSIKLTGKAGDNKEAYVFSPEPKICVDKDSRYLLSCWIKAEDKDEGLVSLVMHSDESWVQHMRIKPDTEWTKFSTIVEFTELNAGDEFEVLFYLPDDYNGAVWVDGFEFKRIRLPNDYLNKEVVYAGEGTEGNVFPDPYVENEGFDLTYSVYDTENVKTGQKSVKIYSGGNVIMPDIMIDRTQKYMLKMFIKNEKSNVGRVDVSIAADDGTEYNELTFVPRKEWIEYATVVDFSDIKESDEYDVKIAVNGNQAWVDNIRMVPLDEKERKFVRIDSVENLSEDCMIKGHTYIGEETLSSVAAVIYDSGGVLKGCEYINNYNNKYGLNYYEFNVGCATSKGDKVKIFVYTNDGKFAPFKATEEYII